MQEPIKLVFWWIPQVPMKPFEFSIDNISTGRILYEAFA